MNGLDLSLGYELLSYQQYAAAVDLFKELENVLMIVGVENTIRKTSLNNLRNAKKLKNSGEITAEKYNIIKKNIVSSYKSYSQYARKQEQEIYNKLSMESKCQ